MFSRSLIVGIALALGTVVLFTIFAKPTAVTEGPAATPQTVPQSTSQTMPGDPVTKHEAIATNNASADPTPEVVSAGVEEQASTIEIYGRVTDEHNQPLEGVLVADEINLGRTRSEADGSYRISVQQPRYKTPILIFLMEGYREKRVGVATQNTPRKSSYEINVALQSSADTTNVSGWVGNALGEGLGSRKIAIRARAGQSVGIKFYTVITTTNGDFLFEGVRAGVNYKLVIEPSEQYAGFTLEPLLITRQTPRLTIILDRLKLVDVEGLIVGIDNAPVTHFSMNVENLSLNYPDRKVTSDSSGFFALQGFPAGDLKLSTSAPQYFKITDLVIGTDAYQSRTLVIDRGNHFLSGWISDNNGVPIEKARVTLSAKFPVNGYRSHSHRSAITDNSGRYQFSNLGAVDHQITVYASGYETHVETLDLSSFVEQHNIQLTR